MFNLPTKRNYYLLSAIFPWNILDERAVSQVVGSLKATLNCLQLIVL